MAEMKEMALVKATQGETNAWLALQSIPDEAARQALAVIATHSTDLALRVLALVAGSGQGKDGARSGLEFRGALYAADREFRTGERLGLHFYWTPEMGPIDSVIGIRDRVSRNIGPVDYRKRALTAEEAEANGLILTGNKPDLAVAYEITVQRDRRAAVQVYQDDLIAYKLAVSAVKARAEVLDQKVDPQDLPPMPVIQYQPVTGIGIVLAEEMYEGVYTTVTANGKYGPYQKKTGKKPREQWGGVKAFDFINYSWGQKAETRALRAGFRRVPGALAEYQQTGPAGEGVTLDLPEHVSVSREQMLGAIEQEEARVAAIATLDELTPDERAAVIAAMEAGAFPPGGFIPGPGDLAQLAEVASDAIEDLRYDAVARDAGGNRPPTDSQRASGWHALQEAMQRAFGEEAPDGGTFLRVVFGHEDFATVGEAAAVFYFVMSDVDEGGRGVSASAVTAVRAILLGAMHQAEAVPDDNEDGAAAFEASDVEPGVEPSEQEVPDGASGVADAGASDAA